MKRLIVTLVVLVGLALPVAAQAFDREPVRLRGLYPDYWGNSLGNAILDVKDRYPGSHRVYCTGAIMVGYEEDSWWYRGTARYWDKMVCAVKINRWSNAGVIFVYDPKSSSRAVIYRKRNFNF